jgi:hypothetical protein
MGDEQMPQTTTQPDFATLLERATTEPGIISRAYFAFHGYSLGNRILAAMQCLEREIPFGPIASFNRWKELGRHVTKGSKALELCQPVTVKRTDEQTGEDVIFTKFIYRRNWFVLAQTEGQDYTPPPPAGWDKARALAALNVTEIPFDHCNGNVQGFARQGRQVAINPVAALPYKTLFHELAHILLGHVDAATLHDDEQTPRNIQEVEAEATAMLCCAALELPGLDESRGYIQNWARNEPISEPSARRIIKTADAILRAGRQEPNGKNIVDDPGERDVDR